MRISVWIVLFFIFLNAWAGMLELSGVAQSHGFSTNPGNTDQIQESRQEAKQAPESTGGAIGGTLIGAITAGIGILTSLFDILYLGPTMLKNLLPGTTVNLIIDFLAAGLVFIAAIDTLGFIRPGGVD